MGVSGKGRLRAREFPSHLLPRRSGVGWTTCRPLLHPPPRGARPMPAGVTPILSAQEGFPAARTSAAQ